MQTITTEQKVSLEKDRVWELLSDLSKPDYYVPGLTHVEFTTDAHCGVGASRRVRQGKSLLLDETVEDWQDGESISLRLHRGEKGAMPPFKRHYFDYRVQSRDGNVYLVNSMRYEMGLGFLGGLLDKLLLRKFMLAQLEDVTLAQKLYYESGERVTPDMLKTAKQHLDR